MTDHSAPMVINAFLADAGHHEAAWRLPESNATADWDLDHWITVAREAERGGLHSLFLADTVSLFGTGRYQSPGSLDPLILLTALAGATERIGLIATISTTYNEPYGLARRLASADHVSGGRIGWNVVTSVTDEEAANFGLAGQIDYDSRYARAEEFLQVCTELWDSWDDDAIIADKATGRYTDPAKLRPIDHDGTFFRVAGPLNVPRPPQGHPLIVQAGSSEAGIAFAGRWADIVFTAHQSLERAREFHRTVKASVADAGRSPDALKVMPGLVSIVGSTEAEARAKADRLDDHIVLENGIGKLEFWLGRSLAELGADDRLPDAWFNEQRRGVVSRADLIFDMAAREQLTVRQIVRRLGAGRGHVTVTGTPEQVADHMEQWFRGGAADGFNIMPARLPADLTDFVDQVLPVLERRGLFRPAESGRTLRENVGVERPANQYAVQPASGR